MVPYMSCHAFINAKAIGHILTVQLIRTRGFPTYMY